jgi:hypothetical protein
MIESKNLKRIIISLLVFIFMIGLALRIYWTRGGPEWAYLYGDLLILLVYFVTGLLVTFQAAIRFAHAMQQYSYKKEKLIMMIIKKQGMFMIIGLLATVACVLISISRFSK